MMNWKCISGFWPTEICHSVNLWLPLLKGANASWTHVNWVTEQVARDCFRPHSTKTVTKTVPFVMWLHNFVCTSLKKYFVETHDPCKDLSLRNNLPNQWDTHPGISTNTQSMVRPASLSGLFFLFKWMLSTQPSMKTGRARVVTIQSATFHLVIWWPVKSLLPEQLSNTILCSIGLFYYPN